MKKLLSATIAAILCMFLCFPVALSAMAASLAKVTFNDVAARKGEYIEIIVSLSDCQEIKSMAVVPLYDSERLEYISGEWLIGNALLIDWNQPEQNGVILYSSETDVNGDIAKFVFKLTDNDSWEDIDFSCKVVLKNGNSTIEVEVETVKIYITCDHECGDEVYTKNSTCTEEGYTFKLCSVCNREIKLTDIEKIAHTASDWIVDKEATLDEEGLQHKECTVCKKVIEEQIIPHLGQCNHVLGEDVFVKDPTYSESGYVYRICRICGEDVKLFDLDSLGMKPWLVAVIAVGTGVVAGFIVFLVCYFVLLKRKKS
ncbi:MAG: cohesin domain-containing protein [Clostridia bacterium]|nr:cohesin domain-containing protein [Clostridia bacterium]